MENLKNYQQKGFVRDVLILLVALVTLKYFADIDVVGYLSEGPLTKALDWLKENVWQRFVHK